MPIYLNMNRDYPRNPSDIHSWPTGLIVKRIGPGTQRLFRNRYYIILWRSGDRYYVDEVAPTRFGWERVGRYGSGAYFSERRHFHVPSALDLLCRVNMLRVGLNDGMLPSDYFFSNTPTQPIPFVQSTSRFTQRRWPPGVEGAPITRPRRYSSMTEEIV